MASEEEIKNAVFTLVSNTAQAGSGFCGITLDNLALDGEPMGNWSIAIARDIDLAGVLTAARRVIDASKAVDEAVVSGKHLQDTAAELSTAITQLDFLTASFKAIGARPPRPH